MASRGLNVARWHSVIAAHFQWGRRLSRAFALAPTDPGDNAVPDPDWLLTLVAASGERWPKEIASFVMPTGAKPRGTRIDLEAGDELRPALGQLSEILDKGNTADTQDSPCSVIQSRWLLRLERRLQSEAGLLEPRRVRDSFHYHRRLIKLRKLEPPELKPVKHPKFDVENFTWRRPTDLRGQGYRHRTAAISVATDLAGCTHLVALHSKISNLSALRLLRAVGQAKKAVAVPEETSVERVMEWWYAHLLALALVDGFVAATHLAAWLSPDGLPEPNPKVPGWPEVDLEKHPPGRTWMLAATETRGAVHAYLVPVEMERQRPGEFQFLRNLTYDVMHTQKLEAKYNARSRSAAHLGR